MKFLDRNNATSANEVFSEAMADLRSASVSALRRVSALWAWSDFYSDRMPHLLTSESNNHVCGCG